MPCPLAARCPRIRTGLRRRAGRPSSRSPPRAFAECARNRAEPRGFVRRPLEKSFVLLGFVQKRVRNRAEPRGFAHRSLGKRWVVSASCRNAFGTDPTLEVSRREALGADPTSRVACREALGTDPTLDLSCRRALGTVPLRWLHGSAPQEAVRAPGPRACLRKIGSGTRACGDGRPLIHDFATRPRIRVWRPYSHLLPSGDSWFCVPRVDSVRQPDFCVPCSRRRTTQLADSGQGEDGGPGESEILRTVESPASIERSGSTERGIC